MARVRVPVSLSGRLLATSVALVAVVCLLIGVAATLVMRSYLMDRLDEDVARGLERGAMVVVGQQPPDGGVPSPPRGSRDGSLTAITRTDGMSRGVTFTAAGQLRQLNAAELQSITSLPADERPRTVDVPGLGRFRVAATESPSGVHLIQGTPTADVDDTITTLIWWELGLGAAGVAAAALVGHSLVRRQLRPLREVAETADRVTRLDLTSGEVEHIERVPDSLTDPETEVGQVGSALNSLLGHVEVALAKRHESEQQARRFLADASHELRTPLSTIKGYAELSRRMSAPDELTAVLGKVDTESQRMTRLVEGMLLLARLDAGRELTPRRVDLSRLVAEAVHDAAVVDPDRTWTVDVPPTPVVVDGDEQQLHQLVTNLLRNASRHTPAGTGVSTALVTAADTVRLSVCDDGPGIDPALLPTVFDRFTRGDSSRTRASGGAGLGTSLVLAIAQAHGGDATVTSVPGETRFEVTLPRSTH